MRTDARFVLFGTEAAADRSPTSRKFRAPSPPDTPPGQPQPRIPAYKKIRDGIQARVWSGQLKPGDLIDSERKLAKIHSVSLMTARHALTELARDGMVRRSPSAGTVVTQPRVHFNRLISHDEQMAAQNLSSRSKTLAFVTMENEEIAARLLLPPTHSLIKLERLWFGGKEPFVIETCYLPATEFNDLSRAKLERGSLFSFLASQYGVYVSYSDEEIDTTAVHGASARLLQIPPGFPLLRVRQTIYSTRARPLLYGVGLYQAGRHRLLVRRFR